jgi:hypothetical protein
LKQDFELQVALEAANNLAPDPLAYMNLQYNQGGQPVSAMHALPQRLKTSKSLPVRQSSDPNHNHRVAHPRKMVYFMVKRCLHPKPSGKKESQRTAKCFGFMVLELTICVVVEQFLVVLTATPLCISSPSFTEETSL